jgi:hypothetical protein
MNNTVHGSSKQTRPLWQRASGVAIASTMILGNYSAQQASAFTQTSANNAETAVASDMQLSQTVQIAKKLDAHRGHFGLTILQPQGTLSYVTARVSLKAKRSNSYLAERLIGDFRYKLKGKIKEKDGKYKLKSKAKFIRGLNAGDRVVIRLFNQQNQLIGYTECDLLSDNAAITLILPDQPNQYGVVRTVYGIDTNQDGLIDSSTRAYDYFTQVTGSSYSEQRVTFLSSSQTINPSSFQIAGLPTPPQNCTYTNSFTNGNFAVVNRTVQVFSSNLASAITAPPGQVVQVIDVSDSNVSTYEASNLILNYKAVGVSEGSVTSTSDYEYKSSTKVKVKEKKGKKAK